MIFCLNDYLWRGKNSQTHSIKSLILLSEIASLGRRWKQYYGIQFFFNCTCPGLWFKHWFFLYLLIECRSEYTHFALLRISACPNMWTKCISTWQPSKRMSPVTNDRLSAPCNLTTLSLISFHFQWKCDFDMESTGCRADIFHCRRGPLHVQ